MNDALAPATHGGNSPDRNEFDMLVAVKLYADEGDASELQRLLRAGRTLPTALECELGRAFAKRLASRGGRPTAYTRRPNADALCRAIAFQYRIELAAREAQSTDPTSSNRERAADAVRMGNLFRRFHMTRTQVFEAVTRANKTRRNPR